MMVDDTDSRSSRSRSVASWVAAESGNRCCGFSVEVFKGARSARGYSDISLRPPTCSTKSAVEPGLSIEGRGYHRVRSGRSAQVVAPVVLPVSEEVHPIFAHGADMRWQ